MPRILSEREITKELVHPSERTVQRKAPGGLGQNPQMFAESPVEINAGPIPLSPVYSMHLIEPEFVSP